ncbi:MAG: J domain-containing protein [Deltaproteobacteria bacterium]|nr:J domain-containing protein [Deltaproteobacteria bacterium]
MDYYRILGLRPDASIQEIKSAYRELAMQYHPDRNGGDPEREERLKEINQAYYVLGNEERRWRYDVQSRGSFEDHLFYQNSGGDELFNLLRKFSRMDVNAGWTGGCRGKGFGRRGCGRWKR